MEIVSETMASVGDFGASLASLVADGAAGAVDQVVALLSPDSVLQLVLIILGLALLVYLVLCLVYHSVRGLYTFTLPWLLSLVSTPNLKDKYGAWAVVTGSTQVGKLFIDIGKLRKILHLHLLYCISRLGITRFLLNFGHIKLKSN